MENTDKLDFGRLTGQDVKIAIIDSGVDSKHPEIGPIIHGIDIRIDSERISLIWILYFQLIWPTNSICLSSTIHHISATNYTNCTAKSGLTSFCFRPDQQ